MPIKLKSKNQIPMQAAQGGGRVNFEGCKIKCFGKYSESAGDSGRGGRVLPAGESQDNDSFLRYTPGMATKAELRDVTGFRGEKIVELCLTDYAAFSRPLFRPGFLGDKWPAIDFYVELTGLRGRRPYFLVQSKATSATLRKKAGSVQISSTKRDIERLLQIPGPTYILGIHEPSRRVFVKSVHTGVAKQAITRIQFANELTSDNLRRLYDEVRGYWQTTGHKPVSSVFT